MIFSDLKRFEFYLLCGVLEQVHSNRSCVCSQGCLLEMVSRLDRLVRGIIWVKNVVMGEQSQGSDSKTPRKFWYLCDFSRGCIERLKLKELRSLIEKKQWHQAGWPITSADFLLQCLTEGHVPRKLYHNHVNNHNSPVMFLSQLWNPISFSIRKGVYACVCVYKTYSR